MHKRRNAALWYARRGWLVFPVWPIRDGDCGCSNPTCDRQGKHPISDLVPNGHLDATTDLKLIQKWWSDCPDANVATSSWLRIDVDTDKNGKVHWRDLTERHWYPETVHAVTPSGGDHYYFRPPEGVTLSNGTGDLPSGIDVRGEGSGYTILPPSNHLEGVYEWELSGRPDEVAIAPAPDWLLELLIVDEGTLCDVEFGQSAGRPDLEQWQLSSVIEAAILNDRSRIDQAIITALVYAGASNDEIRAVFQHYETTGKYAGKGRQADRYLAHSIAKARAYVARQRQQPTGGNGQGDYVGTVESFRQRRVKA